MSAVLLTLLTLFLALILLLFIIAPLLPSERERHRRQVLGESKEGTEAQRVALAASLGALEFDYRMGDLLEADYHALRDRYRRQAAALFHSANGYEAMVDEEIELAVRELRASRSQAGGETCPACGAVYGVEGRFCPQCGAQRGGDAQ